VYRRSADRKNIGHRIAHVFGSLAKPVKTVAGYEPDIAFTLLGCEDAGAGFFALSQTT